MNKAIVLSILLLIVFITIPNAIAPPAETCCVAPLGCYEGLSQTECDNLEIDTQQSTLCSGACDALDASCPLALSSQVQTYNLQNACENICCCNDAPTTNERGETYYSEGNLIIFTACNEIKFGGITTDADCDQACAQSDIGTPLDFFTVRGRVLNESGQPVNAGTPGSSARVWYGATGTTTDANGNYVLNSVGARNNLTVWASYPGCNAGYTYKVPFDSDWPNADITLDCSPGCPNPVHPDITSVEEVYGTHTVHLEWEFNPACDDPQFKTLSYNLFRCTDPAWTGLSGASSLPIDYYNRADLCTFVKTIDARSTDTDDSFPVTYGGIKEGAEDGAVFAYILEATVQNGIGHYQNLDSQGRPAAEDKVQIGDQVCFSKTQDDPFCHTIPGEGTTPTKRMVGECSENRLTAKIPCLDGEICIDPPEAPPQCSPPGMCERCSGINQMFSHLDPVAEFEGVDLGHEYDCSDTAYTSCYLDDQYTNPYNEPASDPLYSTVDVFTYCGSDTDCTQYSSQYACTRSTSLCTPDVACVWSPTNVELGKGVCSNPGAVAVNCAGADTSSECEELADCVWDGRNNGNDDPYPGPPGICMPRAEMACAWYDDQDSCPSPYGEHDIIWTGDVPSNGTHSKSGTDCKYDPASAGCYKDSDNHPTSGTKVDDCKEDGIDFKSDLADCLRDMTGPTTTITIAPDSSVAWSFLSTIESKGFVRVSDNWISAQNTKTTRYCLYKPDDAKCYPGLDLGPLVSDVKERNLQGDGHTLRYASEDAAHNFEYPIKELTGLTLVKDAVTTVTSIKVDNKVASFSQTFNLTNQIPFVDIIFDEDTTLFADKTFWEAKGGPAAGTKHNVSISGSGKTFHITLIGDDVLIGDNTPSGVAYTFVFTFDNHGTNMTMTLNLKLTTASQTITVRPSADF
ncbi:MAG: carboxypeptidase-like regulatory domain-containing protein, partial [Nanoarchaeota archaeon]